MAWIHVEDPSDKRLDPFRTAADPALVREAGLFVAEGRRVVSDLLVAAPERVRAVLVTHTAREALGASLEAVAPDVPRLLVSGPSVLRAITGVHFHQGCIVLASCPSARDVDALMDDVGCVPHLWLVLEGVTDPDNVGTLFRSAASFGVGAVLLGPGCAHPLYRKALRTSVGTALRLPFAESVAWPGDLERLRRRGVEVVALSPRADAPDLATVRQRVQGPVAVLMGSEGEGLTAAAFETADHWARIPLDATVDSLNVAAAGAIALYTFRSEAR